MNPIFLSAEATKVISGIMKNNAMPLEKAIDIYNTRARARRNEIYELSRLQPERMTKQEVIEATWKLPELTDSLYDMLSENGGFMTGSNVISNITNANDEDWCVILPPHVFDGYSIGQSDHGYWEADGFSSIYCHYKSRLVNIICFSDTNLFSAWSVATETMKAMRHWLPIVVPGFWRDKEVIMGDLFATKWKRVILFRAIKDIAYEPSNKKPMDMATAAKYNKCRECSREAIYFTCAAAKKYYEENTVCERCAGITY